jgi:hypothetical protein
MESNAMNTARGGSAYVFMAMENCWFCTLSKKRKEVGWAKLRTLCSQFFPSSRRTFLTLLQWNTKFVKYIQAYTELRHQNIKTVILEPTTKQRKRRSRIEVKLESSQEHHRFVPDGHFCIIMFSFFHLLFFFNPTCNYKLYFIEECYNRHDEHNFAQCEIKVTNTCWAKLGT